MTDSRASPDRPMRLPPAIGRLWQRRFVLLVTIVLLLILAIAGSITLAGAGAVFLAVAVAIALIPAQEPELQSRSGALTADADGLLPGTRRFAAALPDPCFILGRDGLVRFANDRAVATFGIHQGELLPFRLRNPELVAAFDRVAKGGGPEQVQFIERVPTERSFSAWFIALDAEADPSNILLILDDLSAFHATERMRADFVANASHELRTPLASLVGFIETLQGKAKDDPAARERFLSIMHDQATRMSRLIDDLLSLSRVEMRAHLRPRDRADLVAVLRHVADTMAPLARDLGVVIEHDLPEGQVIIPGDRDELVQVFENLVENACKYGQSGGRVVLRMALPERAGPASATVVDFGPGIAPEHLPRLTERFYRVDADESRRHRGTGLGLAIVKHIVTRHRARLQIDSKPGAGAQFTVHFPDAEFIQNSSANKSMSNQPLALS